MAPRTLKIKGHTYKIRQATRRELGPTTNADCDNELNAIRIYKRAVPSRKVELILHEVLHAMLDGYEIVGEEHIVVSLGEALTDFIRSNPGFIKHALNVLK